jgi:hypothetical protein
MFGVRKSCSQCGAPVDTFAADEMDAELKAEAKQAEAFMGEPVASAWRCVRPSCAEVGFFGGVHVGF